MEPPTGLLIQARIFSGHDINVDVTSPEMETFLKDQEGKLFTSVISMGKGTFRCRINTCYDAKEVVDFINAKNDQ